MENFEKFREDKLSRMLKIERFAGETFAKMAQNREIRESFSPRKFLPLKYYNSSLS